MSVEMFFRSLQEFFFRSFSCRSFLFAEVSLIFFQEVLGVVSEFFLELFWIVSGFFS